MCIAKRFKLARCVRRLRTEIEHICAAKEIIVTTKSKRIQCRTYILELFRKLENHEESNNSLSCISPATTNDTYISIAGNKDDIRSVFVKQTLEFQEQMKSISVILAPYATNEG